MDAAPPTIQPIDYAPRPRRPWEAEELFLPAPAEPQYGYVADRQRHGATPQELVERCRASTPHVDLVWTPQSPHLVPPAEVPWLLPAVRERVRADLRHNLLNGLALTGVWSALAVIQALGGFPVALLAVLVFLLGVVPTIQPAVGLWRLRRRPDEYPRELAGTFRYQVWLGTRRMTTTWLLAGCIIAVGLAQVVAGTTLVARVHGHWGLGDALSAMSRERVIESAALVKTAIRGGEVWRLLTAELMHGHPLHFLFNFMALMAVGRLVEMHGHRVYVPAVFLFSALCASAASFYFSAAPVSVGASGGIMGLIGFLAVIGLRRRHVVPRGFLKSIAMSIALTAATGLVARHYIDNAAHAGGLVGGIMLGLVYVRRRSRDDGPGTSTIHLPPSVLARAAGWISGAALVVTAVVTVWLLMTSARV